MNILVTGGASGLGEAITRSLASRGDFRVFFTFNASAEKAQVLTSQYGNARAIPCDFTKEWDLVALTGKMADMDLDCLVNNAITGMTEKHFHKMAPGDFLAHFQNYLLPTIRITQKAIEVFRKKKFGKIINILTSALAGNPPVGLSEYTASKAYLASLSKSWAVENARFNITSNSVSPSLMRTQLTAAKDERIFEEFIKNHPLQRLLTPEEAAEAVLFLVRSSQQINGINLLMNAGSDS